ncbi:bifunctional metallophosphatase/5'-nucleotidase [Salininema proteolyticum]|uniref:Bifunctional metallophosphatase/5'-nucleotidase n=1 Tax=Salininema proteolyticum TaxID=1607685 RepID=A0ABV8U4K4_9ACTN
MPEKRSQRRGRYAAGLVAAALLTATAACSTEEPDFDTVDVQLLAFNDFHGRVGADESMTMADSDGDEVPAGGAEYLATHLAQAREGQDNTVTAAAGDLVGASPFLSAAFNDEPSLKALDELGLDVSSVGNHEFDGGVDELKRLIDGGCPEEGCAEGQEEWAGTGFEYLGANVVDEETGDPVLDPTWVKDFGDGVKVGFIGMTLEGTDKIVSQEGIRGVEFKEEVETANKYAEELSGQGVDAITVLLHEGGFPVEEEGDYDCDSVAGSTGVSGPVIDIAENLDPAIDLMITGHTHQNYVCNIPDPDGNDRLVTSAESYGRVFTDIQAEYDTEAGDFVRTSVEGSNLVVTRDVEADAAQSDILAQYEPQADEIGSEVIGHISEDITRGETRAEEFPLGNFLADVQLDRTSGEDVGGAEIAVMNPGGVRDDLLAGDDGEVTYEAAFSVQPFGNYLVTMDLTGAQIKDVLRDQWVEREDGPLILQWSEGFTYTVDDSAEGADKLKADTVELDGEPIEDDRSYRVTTNSFLADGGDDFAAFADGTERLVGEVDIDAVLNWFAENTDAGDKADAPAADRITVE